MMRGLATTTEPRFFDLNFYKRSIFSALISIPYFASLRVRNICKEDERTKLLSVDLPRKDFIWVNWP